MSPRLRAAFQAYLFGVVGVFLLFAPWSSLWEEGTRFVAHIAVGSWIRSGWFRGAVSGIGLLDLIVAAREARLTWSAFPARGGEGSPAGGADA